MTDTERARDPDDADGGTAGAGVDARRRPNLTGRAAVLAVVVCMLAISLAYPLREYLAQRGDIGAYRALVSGQEQRVVELEKARDRWRDRVYVEAQARERLRYVMPGETAYIVLEADEAPAPDRVVEKPSAEVRRRPWFGDLWHSVEVAGRG